MQKKKKKFKWNRTCLTWGYIKYVKNWIKWNTSCFRNSKYNQWWKFYNCTRARKKSVSNLSDELCEEQAFPYLLSKGKFGYKAPQDIPISPAWYLFKGCWTLISTLRQIQIVYFLPQPFTKYLRLALVCMWNSALRKKFNFCFSKFFC